MDYLELVSKLSQPSPNKIILLVLDGLGGLPHPDTGKTELATAHTPNLDHLATGGICGLSEIVGPGITPGSGAGHLSLFGYDPIKYNIGRGVLEAVGINFNLEPGDIAARCNFCTVDENGMVIDRRAGRISSETGTKLCQLLDGMVIEDVKVIVRPVREHRFVVVFRGSGLNDEVTDSDPQCCAAAPNVVTALSPAADKMARVANQFLTKAREILAPHHPANMLLMRGFSENPNFPNVRHICKLKSAAIAVYPMYLGVARLVGMNILKTGATLEDEIATLRDNYADYDFFFMNVKWTDSAGEDGDFDRKVRVIEEFDKALTDILSLEPEVVIVTGDHSTPAIYEGHSWHPVPVLLHSKWCRPDDAREFSESACVHGGLGRFPATHIMPLALAHARRLTKFGA